MANRYASMDLPPDDNRCARLAKTLRENGVVRIFSNGRICAVEDAREQELVEVYMQNWRQRVMDS